MLIVGAKGFAKEVLEVCHQNGDLDHLVFYDDVNDDIGDMLYDTFPILKSLEQAQDYFRHIDNRFTLGIGNPILRKQLCNKFAQTGGVLSSTISGEAIIGSFGNRIYEGCNIMPGAVLTNDIIVSKGTIINQLTSIGHDVMIEEFCEICPNVSISGNCKLGPYTFIGTGAIILPKVVIGKNVIIGAGSVVTKDIPDNSLALGMPAKVVKQLEPLKF